MKKTYYVVNEVDHNTKALEQDEFEITLLRVNPPSRIEHHLPVDIKFKILGHESARALENERPMIIFEEDK
mgnify:CR=1 FL=1